MKRRHRKRLLNLRAGGQLHSKTEGPSPWDGAALGGPSDQPGMFPATEYLSFREEARGAPVLGCHRSGGGLRVNGKLKWKARDIRMDNFRRNVKATNRCHNAQAMVLLP